MTVKASDKCLWLAAGICATLTHVCAMAQQNPLERHASPETVGLIIGRWNGANLERRSNCSAAQNNGTRGTYAEFVIVENSNGDFGITETGITGTLNCDYVGKARIDGTNRSATGTFSCSDGKRGDFQTKGMLVTENAVSIRMDIQLNTTESCTIDAIIGGSRFYP